ncbi:hypothetical protein B566_EDAN018610 [Ephemera danica]|nr:hypothetical protein B566_EDAN018610 [Ephemera danica]
MKVISDLATTNAIARENARRAGVAERVQFVLASATELPLAEGGWDFITSFDCIHDVGQPHQVLRRIREALAPHGTYLMVEPKVAERLHDNAANPFARMLYGLSCLHCVPVSLAQGGPGLGACWGETRARLATQEAGFAAFKVLPIRSPAPLGVSLLRASPGAAGKHCAEAHSRGELTHCCVRLHAAGNFAVRRAVARVPRSLAKGGDHHRAQPRAVIRGRAHCRKGALRSCLLASCGGPRGMLRDTA